MAFNEPEGDLVTGPPAIDPSSLPSTTILGKDTPFLSHGITLRPLIQSHFNDLFTNLCGPGTEHLYKYLPGGPFPDIESLTKHMQWLIDEPSCYAFSIFSADKTHLSNQTPQVDDSHKNDSEEGTAISVICLLNISSPNRSIEIGHVLYPPTLQRTTPATAAYYLLMKFCFQDLHYQRVEWKCNDRNEPSKRAALRLGFTYEGTFRKHMVVRGRRRDSAWFSVLDDEWKGYVGAALEKWLEVGNFDEEGKQKRKLEDIRREVQLKRIEFEADRVRGKR
ncbi:acyl-CoA N-acyltransferase [Hyaloscypha hepaticicola]|uniref:Acyl-CoA N-acyltransferase n=1 Tax=Hyaloscypha hepaticicola TaxID=2082293 RepID=A0A2J6Q0K7_9HELO|nr:acyl-CoA N-acyltransferase [Hyaloscypha hepaticicola]